MVQTLGIVDIIWRGRAIPAKKGAKIKPGGLENQVVVAGRKVGRSQQFVATEVTATTNFERGQRFEGAIWSTDEGELQVVCDTGQTFVCRDAFLTERPEITGGEDGQYELKWAGGACEEVL